MTVERYATARDLFEAARTAAQELERTATQRELLASRRGYRSPSLSGAGGGCSADAGGMRASDALIDYEAMMRGRVAEDAELLEFASHVLYGENGVRLRPHSARHTADTLFANAGVPESARLALMGHSDAAMDNVYLHADTEALLKASEGATGALGLND